MAKKKLKLDQIRLDGDTQPRVAIDEDLVAEYADAYAAGIALPPLVVFHDGASYWLVDGFHRRWAAIKAGIKSVPCIVHEGTLQDARWFSYATNQAHGLRRSNADKAKAVRQALKHPTGVTMSDRQIAEHIGVTAPTVAKYRAELEATVKNLQSASKRTGKDGKQRGKPIKQKTPSATTAPSSAPVDEQEDDSADCDVDEAAEDEVAIDSDEQPLSEDDETMIAIEDTVRDQFRGRLAVAAARLEALAEKLRKDA